MPSYVTPKKNTEYIFYVGLVDQADTLVFKSSPTIAAGDFKVSIDGGALANPATLPAVTPGASKMVKITLSASEMNGDNVTVICSDASGAEWCDLIINIQTSARQVDDLSTQASVDTLAGYVDTEVAAIKAKTDNLPASPAATGDIPSSVTNAAAVWDSLLTGATHNISTSAGRRLRELSAASIRSETAQAGAANSITLDAGASATSNIYDSNLIVIVEGTGVGQSRVIVEYDGSTKVAIVDRVWEINPDATSVFEIIADHQARISQHGLAQAGSTSTITLSSTASPQDNIYVGQIVAITTSLGTGQSRLITDYDGTTKIATVSPDWDINPSSASVYIILPAGQTIVHDLSATALASLDAQVDTAFANNTAAIADAVLDEAIAEPGGVFAWGGATLRNIVGWLGALSRNKMLQTATITTLRNDADLANIATSGVADDGTTFTKDEWS